MDKRNTRVGDLYDSVMIQRHAGRQRSVSPIGSSVKAGHDSSWHTLNYDFIRQNGPRRRFHDGVLGQLFAVIRSSSPTESEPGFGYRDLKPLQLPLKSVLDDEFQCGEFLR